MTALVKATYGIFFLPTPHKALLVEDIASILNKLDPNHPRLDLVEQLRCNSPALEGQLTDFKNVYHTYEYKIVSFFETQQTRVLKWVSKQPLAYPVGRGRVLSITSGT